MSRSISSVLAVAVVAVALCGCRNKSGPPPSTAPHAPKPLAPPVPGAMRLKTGRPPYSYSVGSAGVLRVVDATSGKTLAERAVPVQTIVRIDPQDGIYFGTTRVAKGPLQVDRQYELWLSR